MLLSLSSSSVGVDDRDSVSVEHCFPGRCFPALLLKVTFKFFLGRIRREVFGDSRMASCCNFTNRSFPNTALELVSLVLRRFLLSSTFVAMAASNCSARCCPRYPSVRPPTAALASFSISIRVCGLSTRDRTCCLRCRTALVLLGVAGGGGR